jgi:hypothetical protein
MVIGILFFLLGLGLLALFLVPKGRSWFLEEAKAASDFVVLIVLRSTSRFARDLTEEGSVEQGMWRQQRLRNLRGLPKRRRPEKLKTDQSSE